MGDTVMTDTVMGTSSSAADAEQTQQQLQQQQSKPEHPQVSAGSIFVPDDAPVYAMPMSAINRPLMSELDPNKVRAWWGRGGGEEGVCVCRGGGGRGESKCGGRQRGVNVVESGTPLTTMNCDSSQKGWWADVASLAGESVPHCSDRQGRCVTRSS